MFAYKKVVNGVASAALGCPGRLGESDQTSPREEDETRGAGSYVCGSGLETGGYVNLFPGVGGLEHVELHVTMFPFSWEW